MKRQARGERAMQRALDAALELATAERGFRPTIQEVSARAKVSVGSLYHHFGSQQRLTFALYQRCLDAMLRFIADAVIDAPDAEIGIADQGQACPIGHDQLAVGQADVAGDLLDRTRRVDADDRRTGERRGSDPEEVLGHVLEAHPDVERARAPHALRQVGPPGTRLDHLAPRPALVGEQQTRVRVTGARPSGRRGSPDTSPGRTTAPFRWRSWN